MGDLKDPRWMVVKGVLFVGIGLIAAVLVFLEASSWKMAGLLCLCVWGFARAYYFAFYVIGKYIDPTYRFSGLWSAMRYLARRRKP